MPASGTSVKWRATVYALSVLTFIALLASAWALYDRFSAQNQRRAENAATWRAVVCAIEMNDLTNPFLSPQAKLSRLKFYDGLLVNQVHTKPCGLKVV